MYRLWKQDPNSVHPSWNVYFSGMAKGLKSEDAFRPPPNLLDLAEMSTEGSAELPLSQGSDVQDHMKVGAYDSMSMVSIVCWDFFCCKNALCHPPPWSFVPHCARCRDRAISRRCVQLHRESKREQASHPLDML